MEGKLYKEEITLDNLKKGEHLLSFDCVANADALQIFVYFSSIRAIYCVNVSELERDFLPMKRLIGFRVMQSDVSGAEVRNFRSS